MGRRQTRQNPELFIHLAEIAGVFVGFGALIAVRSGGASDAFEVVHMRFVVWIGLLTVVAALAPVALGFFDLAEHQVWALSSVLFLAGFVVMFVASARTPEYRANVAAGFERARTPTRSRWIAVGENAASTVFSRDTLWTWTLDHMKAVLIALVLGLIGSGLLYATIRVRPSDWWVWAGVVFSLAMGTLVRLAPVLLFPIFYRVSPLDRDALRARLKSLAERTRCRIVDVFEWHLGDHSRRANAMLVGLGPTRRILVSDTLLAEYSDDEIEAILAHELGHHVRRDIWRAMASESVFMFAGFFAAFHTLRTLGPWARLEGPGDVAGPPLVLLAVGLVSVLQMPFANALSRHHERQADRFALRIASRPEALASAIRRLAPQNLAEEGPSWLVRVLFYTHPPIRERLAAAGQIGETCGRTGTKAQQEA